MCERDLKVYVCIIDILIAVCTAMSVRALLASRGLQDKRQLMHHSATFRLGKLTHVLQLMPKAKERFSFGKHRFVWEDVDIQLHLF
jgi:hypothetical protein